MSYAIGGPVQSSPLLHSKDPKFFSEAMHRHFRSSDLHFKNQPDFEGQARLFRLQDLRFGSVKVSAPGELAVSEVDDFRQAFVRGGQIKTWLDGRDAEYQPGDALVMMPGQLRTYEFGEHFSQILLTIDPLALNGKLAALLGNKPNRKLEFALNSDFTRAHNHHLQALVDLYVQYLNDANPLPPILHKQMQETVIVAFLSANEHTYSRYLHEDVASS
jgi:hypothetical protein